MLWELGELEHAKVQLIKAIQVFKSAKDSFRPHELLHAYSVYAKVLLDLGDVDKSRSVSIDLIEGVSNVYGLNSEETLKAKNILAKILLFSMDHENALVLCREIVEAIDGGVYVSHEFDLDARVSLARRVIY